MMTLTALAVGQHGEPHLHVWHNSHAKCLKLSDPSARFILLTKRKEQKMNNTESAIDALKLANQLLGDMFGIDESEESN
jgi:hypothetical protein